MLQNIWEKIAGDLCFVENSFIKGSAVTSV